MDRGKERGVAGRERWGHEDSVASPTRLESQEDSCSALSVVLHSATLTDALATLPRVPEKWAACMRVPTPP
jgi:hypothetical protein